MKGRSMRRVVTLIAASALTVAMATPAFAVDGSKFGTTSCPSRYSYLQYRFMDLAYGRAPGGTYPGYGPYFDIETGPYWSTQVKAGLIGGGYWWVSGDLDYGDTYAYCN